MAYSSALHSHPHRKPGEMKPVKAWAIYDKKSGKIWGYAGDLQIHHSKRAAFYNIEKTGDLKRDAVCKVSIRPLKKGSKK